MPTTEEIRLRLEALYRAGRDEFPDKAADVSRAAADLRDATETLNGRSAQVGDPATLTRALKICFDSQTGLARVVRTLNECAVGLVYIADTFAATDERAAEASRGIHAALRGGDPPQAATVPTMGDPTPAGDGDEYTSTPDPVHPDDDREERDEDPDSQVPDVPEMPEEWDE